jgi:carnitine-CoA ligase
VTLSQAPSPPTPAATLLESLERQLAAGGGLTFHFDHQPHTLRELAEDASRLGAWLDATVPEGARVGLMARNGRPALLLWWACTFTGRVLVPFNTGVRGAILDHQVRDSDLSLMVVEAEFADVVDESLRGLDQPLDVLVVGAAELPAAASVRPFEPCFAALEPRPLPAGQDRFKTSHLIYTSGTTGQSKACVVSHSYLANLAKHMRENLERKPGDGLWTAMPMFHLAAVGHVIGSLHLDAEISLSRRFSVTRFWEDVVTSGAQVAALMGSMLPLVLKADDTEWTARGFGQLRAVSGVPVTAELAAGWTERFGVERVGSSAYGMTEASLIASSHAGGARPGSAGQPNPDFEVVIVDEQGYPTPAGESGEVVCRPRQPGIMFDGYWRQPERTLETYRGLWFHTGDLGRLEDGHLYFVDRKKDSLRRGGENISSAEIEGVALQHPELLEVAVHAVPSPLSEDDVKVTAVLREGSTLSELAFFDWLHTRVPRFAVPSHIEFRRALPRNAVGRVLKHQLRAEGVTASTVETNWRSRV